MSQSQFDLKGVNEVFILFESRFKYLKSYINVHLNGTIHFFTVRGIKTLEKLK